MDIQTTLSETERDLLLDLLLRERRELPVEIHHTHGPDAHEMLQHRLKAVSDLIDRLQHTTTASGS